MTKAFDYLLSLIEQGWEFPDACAKAATKFDVSHDLLRRMYDDYCQ